MSKVSGISRHSGISGLSNVNVGNADSQNSTVRKNVYPDLVPIPTNSANAQQGIPQLKQNKGQQQSQNSYVDAQSAGGNQAFRKFHRQPQNRIGQNQNLGNTGVIGNALKGNGVKLGAVSSKPQTRKITTNGGKYESLRYETTNQN
jgi:hypothetical protein